MRAHRDRHHVSHSVSLNSGTSTPLHSAASTPVGTPTGRPPAGERFLGESDDGRKRIQLDQLYAYRSLDKVSGSINHTGLLVGRIKVHLVGTAYVSHQRFMQGGYRNVEKSWEFLKLTQKLNLETDASTTTIFAFRLPEALLETHCPLGNPFHLLIPPTLGCRRDDGLDDLSPKDPTNARIEYTIVAELLFEGQVVQTLAKAFRVAPRHFASPHTMNPPPGYDEVINVEADVSRTIGGKIGSLKITRQTPPAVLSSLEEHQITTKVPVTVEFHSTSTGPPKVQAIGIKLRAITASRTEHLLEGQEDIKRHTETRLNKVTFGKHTAPVWRPTRPGVWSTDLEIPVTLCPKGFVAIPEFESCLIDRHYSLILKFELSPTSGLPISETRLAIPVWIMADEYYGIPSEARPGVPVKQMRRFEVPQDVETDAPGSLPMYEDTYLSNLANEQTGPAVVVGDLGTRAAPFSLSGLEPDYFARPRAHPGNRFAGSGGGIAGGGIGGSGSGGNSAAIGIGHHQHASSSRSIAAASAMTGIPGANATSSARRLTRRGTGDARRSGSIDGVEVDLEGDEDEERRVPAWLQKEMERPSGVEFADPRDRDGAQ